METIARHPLVFQVMALAFCASGCSDIPKVNHLFGGHLDIVTQAERAEAFRLNPPDWTRDLSATQPTEPSQSSPQIVGIPVKIGPVEVPPATLQQLAAILKDPRTYYFNMWKLCRFHPDIAVRFWKSEQSITVVFCFTCDELEVFAGDKLVGGEDDDPQRPALVSIAKSLFPADASLAELSATRH